MARTFTHEEPSSLETVGISFSVLGTLVRPKVWVLWDRKSGSRPMGVSNMPSGHRLFTRPDIHRKILHYYMVSVQGTVDLWSYILPILVVKWTKKRVMPRKCCIWSKLLSYWLYIEGLSVLCAFLSIYTSKSEIWPFLCGETSYFHSK